MRCNCNCLPQAKVRIAELHAGIDLVLSGEALPFICCCPYNADSRAEQVLTPKLSFVTRKAPAVAAHECAQEMLCVQENKAASENNMPRWMAAHLVRHSLR
jgi:hypothetical protein